MLVVIILNCKGCHLINYATQKFTYFLEDERMFKKQHFGIRKFTVGAASIAVVRLYSLAQMLLQMQLKLMVKLGQTTT